MHELQLKYVPQLDSIRAIAALMVVFSHYFYTYFQINLHLGHKGVQIFFVLSGFLITYILLLQKGSSFSKGIIIRNFAIKRILRLFPIYFLLLFFLWFVAIAFNARFWQTGNGIFYFTYTSNFLFFFKGFVDPVLNHTWSLAVEEQFYLLWPWIAIFVSRRLSIALVVLSMLFSLLFKSFSEVPNGIFLLSSHIDTMGTGILLAFVFYYDISIIKKWLKYNNYLLWLSLLFLILDYIYPMPKILTNLTIMCLSAALIIGCFFEFKGLFGKFLNLKLIVYLGQISYGVYLYHKVIPEILKLFYFKTNLFFPNYVSASICILLTLIVSHLSYQYIEKVFLRLKENFNLKNILVTST